MKKSIILSISLMFFLFVRTSFIGAGITTKQPNVVLAAQVKLLNDTGRDIYVYTSQGRTRIIKNLGHYVSCVAGVKIHRDNDKRRGSVMFIIDANMCGKTIKLSQYL
jgi:hypothetical protein